MKRPEIDPQHLNAFIDGELDVLRMDDIEARLKHEEGLCSEVQALRQLRHNVRELGDYHVASREFRQRIASIAPISTPVSTRLVAGGGTLQHWLDWRSRGVSLAALGLAVIMMVWASNLPRWRAGKEDLLSQEVVASHVRSTLGQHLVDVTSSDHHTVKPWLSSKLDFSPPVQETLLEGSIFVGGRIDYLDARPVAALVYQQGAHVVNSFVWPTQAADTHPVFLSDRGFQLAHWSHNGMTHWVISDVNRQEFEAIVRSVSLENTSN